MLLSYDGNEGQRKSVQGLWFESTLQRKRRHHIFGYVCVFLCDSLKDRMWFANKNTFFFFFIFWNDTVCAQTETHKCTHIPTRSCLTPTHLCKQPNTPTLLQATDIVKLVVRVTESTFMSKQRFISASDIFWEATRHRNGRAQCMHKQVKKAESTRVEQKCSLHHMVTWGFKK